MNILQIIPYAYPSGTARHVVVLARELKMRGHDVTVLHPIPDRPGEWLPTQLKSFGIRVLEKPMRGLSGAKSVLAMARWVRENKIDVIHTHATRAAFYGFAIGALTRCPVIASVHIETRSIVYRKLLPRGRNQVVAVSNYVRDVLVRHGAPPSRVHTVYNGTDFGAEERGGGETRESVRAEFGLSPEAQLIGVFAYLGELKGQALLVQAAREIVAQCPSAFFFFAGPAPDREREALCALAQSDDLQSDDLQNRLIFAGMRDDVPRLMDAMDVVAVPSRNESFSMVAIEAMALGKPVVGARVGGIPEVISHGETGFVVEREPRAFAEAIVSLLRAPSHCRTLGKAARERANTLFSASAMTGAMETLYRDVVSRNASR